MKDNGRRRNSEEMKFDAIISGCVTEQVSNNNDVDLMLITSCACLPQLFRPSKFKQNSLARIFLCISSHSSSHSSPPGIDMFPALNFPQESICFPLSESTSRRNRHVSRSQLPADQVITYLSSDSIFCSHDSTFFPHHSSDDNFPPPTI